MHGGGGGHGGGGPPVTRPELSNRAQERLAADAVSRFSLCGSFSLQLETIQSCSPLPPARNQVVQGPRKWRGPDSAIAPNFMLTHS